MTTKSLVSDDLFCIEFNDFRDHLARAFRDIYQKKSFSDVTLVTDDQVHLQAHRCILSTNSEVFKSIFENGNLDSKTVYLRGVKKTIMEPILNFCYTGSAEVHQDIMMEFFEVAKDLKIHEFIKMATGQMTSKNFESYGKSLESQAKNEDHKVEQNRGPKSEQHPTTTFSINGMGNQNHVDQELAPKTLLSASTTLNSKGNSVQNINREQKQIHKPVHPISALNSENDNEVLRNLFEQIETAAEIKTEIEEELDMETPENKAAIENFLQSKQQKPPTEATFADSIIDSSSGKFKCDQCDVFVKNEQNLKRHIQNKHEGIKYSCDQCDYKATQSTDIKRHKQYKHEGIKIACEECEYQATTTGSLKLHVDAKHRGIKYPCHLCDLKASTPASLNLHIETRHSDKRFQCEFCDFMCKSKFILKKHKQQKHTYTSNLIQGI